MTMLSAARLLLHPGRRLHDGHPPKRRPLAPVCLFGKCDPVDAERVYRREMDKERQRLVETYEVLEERTPSRRLDGTAMEQPEERIPLTEVVGEDNRMEATMSAERVSREERTPSMDGGVDRVGRVTKRRQIKLTDLWTKTKVRRIQLHSSSADVIVASDDKKRTSGLKKASHC